MYFEAQIEIDPSQITIIRRSQKDNFLNRLLDVVSSDDSKHLEQETFSALQVLNQIQGGLLKTGVDNIILLSVDDFHYYNDLVEQKKDLSIAVDYLSKRMDDVESEHFSSVKLSLEHLDKTFKYYILIEVRRKHAVSEFPIKIAINALLNDFSVDETEDIQGIPDKLDKVFTDKVAYDNFITEKENIFRDFVSTLETNLSEFIKVDGINTSLYQKLVRPNKSDIDLAEIAKNEKGDPVFHGYPGADRYLCYTFFWSILCRDNNITIDNFVLTDSEGNDISIFENHRFDASKSTVLNPDKQLNINDFQGTLVFKGHNYPELAELVSDMDFNKMEVLRQFSTRNS